MNTSALIKYFFKTKKISFILIWLTIVISSASFYTMNGFVETLKHRLYHSARNLSSGDIKISSTQNFNKEQLEKINHALQNKYLTSDMLIFPTMAQRDQGDAFLCSIKAVDTQYPFYGTAILQDQLFKPLQANECYIAKEIANRFNIQPGDFLKIGSQSLQVKGVIIELPDQGISNSSAFNPIVLIRIEEANASGLLQFGSRVSYMKLYKGNHPNLTQEQIEKDAENLESKFNTDGIQVSTWKDSQNISRTLFGRLSSYFNLLTYTSVILASIGFYLGLSAFVLKIHSDSAILYGLGISKAILAKSLYQLFFFIITSGALIGLVIGLTGETYIVSQLDSLVVTVKQNKWHWQLILFTLIFCFASGGIIVRMIINTWLKNLNPLQYQMAFSPNYFSIKGMVFYLLFVLGLLLVFSVLQTGVWAPSFAINGAILLLLILLFAFTLSLLFILRLLNKPFLSSPIMYFANIEFFRNKRQHFPSLLGLILSSVLVLGIITSRDAIKQKLSLDKHSDTPNIFMVDIQKTQLNDIKDLIVKNPNTSNFNESPLIRARLTHINDTPLVTLKEKAKQNNDVRKLNFLNRTFNLTYKDNLNKSEKIVEGKFWQPSYDGPDISLEAEFAKSMGVTIGDLLGFDLAGIQIEGKVTSIRTINWGSLLPNFFVIFPEKKLENAPQFIIGSAHVNPTALSTFQNQLVVDYPNISVIDLTDIFKKVQFLFEKVLKVLVVSSALCIISSLVIMASTLLANQSDTTQRHYLLKSMSMNQNQIFLVDFLEKTFYFISLILATFCLHLVANYFLSQQIKEEINFDLYSFCWYCLTVLILVFAPLLLKLRKLNY